MRHLVLSLILLTPTTALADTIMYQTNGSLAQHHTPMQDYTTKMNFSTITFNQQSYGLFDNLVGGHGTVIDWSQHETVPLNPYVITNNYGTYTLYHDVEEIRPGRLVGCNGPCTIHAGYTATPEPGTWVLLLTGLVSLFTWRYYVTANTL